MNDIGGVWRTIGGRRVFIKDGQDLASAMIESGKFKNLRSDYRKAKKEDTKVKEEEDKKRLEIAKDIAKEIYGKNMSDELLERKAKEILEHQDGEVLEKGDKSYTNANGQIERSTEYLKKWQEDLKKANKESKEEKKETFISQSTNPFYPDKEYSEEELKQMENSGVKPMNNTYSGSGWKGINADKNLSTKEQAKAITDTMKEQYPDVKISRKSDVYSGGSSIDFNIMSSDKDLYISDKDIDKFGSEQLFNTDITRGYGFERWANENVENYRTEHRYSADDVKKYAKETLNNIRNHEEQNVRGNEWYLSDYGKEVVTELNKQANSYTYDDSDAMTDYFNHGTYMNISIGKWNKPYEVNQTTNNFMNNKIRQKAYEKYLKEHPASEMTFQEFEKMNKK